MMPISLGKCSHWIYSCELWRKSFFPSLVNEKIFHSQWMKIFLHCEWKFSFTVNENRIFFIVYKNKFNEIFFQTMKSASLIKSIWMENFEKFFFIGIKPFGLCIDSVSSNLLCFVKCQVLKYSKMLSTESTTTCIVFFHQIWSETQCVKMVWSLSN